MFIHLDENKSFLFLKKENSFYFIAFAFTYMGIYYLGHPPPSGRTCFALLFSYFVEEKT
jgi:hypothetical protein